MKELRIHPVAGDTEINCLLKLLAEGLKGKPINSEVVVVVPESQTLEYEKAITRYAKNGLFRVSVTSPKKIQKSIISTYKYGKDLAGYTVKEITKAGIIARIYSICNKIKDGFLFIRTPRIAIAEDLYDIYINLQHWNYKSEDVWALCKKPDISKRLHDILHDVAIILEHMEEWQISYDEQASADEKKPVRMIPHYEIWKKACTAISLHDYFAGKELIFCGFDEIHHHLFPLLFHSMLCTNMNTIHFVYRLFNEEKMGMMISDFESYVDWQQKETGFYFYYDTSFDTELYPNANGVYNPDIVSLAEEIVKRNVEQIKDRKVPGVKNGMKDITVYTAPDQYTECLHAAQEIIKWHKEGYAWSEIGVVLDENGILSELLPQVLDAASIPYFMSIKHPLLECDSAYYVNKVILSSGSYEQQDMLDIIKSGFADISAKEADLLENYVVTHGIKGSKWLKPFEARANENEKDIEELNAIKDKVIVPIVELHDALKKRTVTIRGQATEIYNYLERSGFYQKLREKANMYLKYDMKQEAEFVRQSWESIKTCLDILAMETFYKDHASLDTLGQLVTEIMYLTGVKFIPQTVDSVLIDRSRMFVPESRKCTVVMSLQEEEIVIREPLLTEEDYKWIAETDPKKVGLAATLSEMGKKAQEIIENNYMAVMSATDKLSLSASMLSHNGQPLHTNNLFEKASSLVNKYCPDNIVGGMQNNGIEPFAHDAAFELLAGMIREYVKYGTGKLSDTDKSSIAEKWKKVFSYFQENEPENMKKIFDSLNIDIKTDDINPDVAKQLYLNSVTSVSELEDFAACPFSHFVTKGLRPVDLRKNEFQADQRGVFYHAAMEAYFRRAELDSDFPQIDRKKIVTYYNEAVAPLLAEMQKGPLAEDTLSKMELVEYAQAARVSAICVTYWLAESNYKPEGYEIEFGKKNSKIPPLELKLDDGSEIALTGKIDRFDVGKDDNGNPIGRIVDYKSSEHTLDRESVEEGLQLQLPLYLSVMMHAYGGMKPTGALYQIVSNPVVDVETDDEEEVKKKVLESFKLSGMYLETENAVKTHGESIRKQGKTQRKNIMSVSEEELNRILENSKEKAASHASRIRSGCIDISPVTVGKNNPCTFCKAKNICGIGNITRSVINQEESENE